MTNKLKIKNLRFGLVGAHTPPLKKAMEKRGYKVKLLPTTHFPRFREIKDVDIIYGAYFQSAWTWFFIGKLAKKKTLCHWVGSDSLLAIKNKKRRIQTKLFSRYVDIHVAVSERIKEELSEIGYESIVLFHGSDIEPEHMALPKKHAALIYFTEDREKLYGLKRIIAISKIFTEIDYYFIGHFDTERYSELYPQKNLHFLGFVNLEELWPKITVVIRMTEHDGFPKTMVEAYSKGRYAIHNYPLPGVIHCQTDDDVIRELKKIVDENQINKDGIKLFEEQFHFDKFLKKFEEICQALYS